MTKGERAAARVLQREREVDAAFSDLERIGNDPAARRAILDAVGWLW
jgi:hypothetical protein